MEPTRSCVRAVQGAFLNQRVDSLSGGVVQEQVTDVLEIGRFLPAPFNNGLGSKALGIELSQSRLAARPS